MTQNDLILQATKGDPGAIKAVIQQYTPLVHKIVNKYSWMAPSHSREDLVQEGLLGVVKAIETFDTSRNLQFMTWVYPQVRGAVQGVARKENRLPKYPVSLDQIDRNLHLEDPNHFEVRDEFASNLVKQVVLAGCGSLNSKRAQIVCDRYGLLGRKPLRQGEVAQKHGMTKQAVNSHIARFSKIVQEKHPELRGFIH